MEDNRSPLHESHAAHGAHFIRYGEAQIPAHFSSMEEEYNALKSSAVLVDCCLDGRFRISGNDREAFLDSLLSIPLDSIAKNTVRGCWLLNPQGGIIDEVEVFRADNFLTVHCGSLMQRRVFSWLKQNAKEFGDVEVADNRSAQGRVEVRGPDARATLESVTMDGSLPDDPNHTSIVQISQARCLVTYRVIRGMHLLRVETGGLFLKQMWERMLSVGEARGAVPAGWQATEAVRIEARLPGSGAEFDELTTPLEIGGSDRVSFNKPDFCGKRALLHGTVSEFARRMIALEFADEKPPEPGDPVEIEEVPLGYVTSATASPSAGAARALGFIDALRANPGQKVIVRSRGRALSATIPDDLHRQSA